MFSCKLDWSISECDWIEEWDTAKCQIDAPSFIYFWNFFQPLPLFPPLLRTPPPPPFIPPWVPTWQRIELMKTFAIVNKLKQSTNETKFEWSAALKYFNIIPIIVTLIAFRTMPRVLLRYCNNSSCFVKLQIFHPHHRWFQRTMY